MHHFHGGGAHVLAALVILVAFVSILLACAKEDRRG